MGILSRSVHLGLFVEDMAAMVAFYRDVLGFEAEWDGGPFASFVVQDGGLFMYDRRLFSEALGQPYVPPKRYNETMEVALTVPSPEDVDREYARLTALGIQSLTGEPVTQPWGKRNFFIADPEGNYVEIASYGGGKRAGRGESGHPTIHSIWRFLWKFARRGRMTSRKRSSTTPLAGAGWLLYCQRPGVRAASRGAWWASCATTCSGRTCPPRIDLSRTPIIAVQGLGGEAMRFWRPRWGARATPTSCFPPRYDETAKFFYEKFGYCCVGRFLPTRAGADELMYLKQL
jgi:catechol 2,3-dioxygenase-like lactoylglutathione lyase family enzyme